MKQRPVVEGVHHTGPDRLKSWTAFYIWPVQLQQNSCFNSCNNLALKAVSSFIIQKLACMLFAWSTLLYSALFLDFTVGFYSSPSELC